VAISISGIQTNQNAALTASLDPFAGIVVNDPINPAYLSTVITVSNALGSLSDDVGTFLTNGTGLSHTGAGTYTLNASTPLDLSMALNKLVFQPTSVSATSARFQLQITDSGGGRSSSSPITLLLSPPPPAPPTIADTTANPLFVVSGKTLSAFSALKVTDTDPLNTTETVTITLGAPPYYYGPLPTAGTLVDSNGGGTFVNGVFTESGLIGGSLTFASSLLNRIVYVAPALASGQGYEVTATVAVSNRSGTTSALPVQIEVVTAPAIGSTVLNQPVASGTAIRPFVTSTIQDNDFSNSTGAQDTATIIVTDSGVATDVDGLLTGAGLSKTGTGTYTLGATNPWNLQTELRGLSFSNTTTVPPGQTQTTKFELDVTDVKASLTSKDTATSVLSVGPNGGPPQISNTQAGQKVLPGHVIDPFSSITISDATSGMQDSLIVTVTEANGSASDTTGTFEEHPWLHHTIGSGVYTIDATNPATLTTEINTLVFTPSPIPAGQSSVTTNFALAVTDSNGTARDTRTTVIEQPPPASPPGGGNSGGATQITVNFVYSVSSQFIIANDDGALYVQDTVAGSVQVLTEATKIAFADGTAVFDPTGNAEDVTRLYLAALHRAPDINGLLAWANIVDSGTMPLDSVAASFAASAEFIQTYGSLADAAFIQQLYKNVLNRAGSDTEVQAWQNTLSAGATRGQVTLGFAESPEGRADTLQIAGDKNDAEAYRLYQAAFNRIPDADGERFWSASLASGETARQVAAAFIGSAEFNQTYGALSTADFVSALYVNALHRPADAAGLQAWTGAIQNGLGRADVLVGFSDSAENRIHTATSTHADWVFVPH
jgi:hypothetical protein